MSWRGKKLTSGFPRELEVTVYAFKGILRPKKYFPGPQNASEDIKMSLMVSHGKLEVPLFLPLPVILRYAEAAGGHVLLSRLQNVPFERFTGKWSLV